MASASAPYRSTHELARAIIILTIIAAALSITTTLYQATGEISDAALYTNPWLASVLSISILIALLNLILFLLWYYRNHRNLPALGASELRFTPGWAVAWWFIPILNLWKPYQVTVEIMKASDPAVGRTDSEAREAMRRPPYVLAWWLFNFIAVGVIIIAYVIAALDAGVEANASETGWFPFVELITTLISSWLTIKVIREIDARQAKKFDLIRSGNYGSP